METTDDRVLNSGSLMFSSIKIALRGTLADLGNILSLLTIILSIVLTVRCSCDTCAHMTHARVTHAPT